MATVAATADERRKFDHRAQLARLIGVYVGEEVPGVLGREAEVFVAMQPDQGGRKLLFLAPNDGAMLGFVELETLGSDGSALRGMLVSEDCRGKGYARLFLAIWLRLCERAGVTPTTSRINKPLLALTLVRLGFTPLRGRDRPGLRGGKAGKARKPKHRPLAVEVSVGSAGRVLLYCPLAAGSARLEAGFTKTELSSQRLVIAAEPPEPRGRVAHIRLRYKAPSQTTALGDARQPEDARDTRQLVHAPLAEGVVGGRLRLHASQGPASGVQTHAAKAEVLRILTGRLVEFGTTTTSAKAPSRSGVPT